MHKCTLTFFFFLFLTFQSIANSSLKFWDTNEKINYLIDFKSNKFYKKNTQGNILESNNFVSRKIDTTSLYEDFQINAFKTKSGFLLTLQGTGQVYLFNPKEKKINRIDKTHFAGYNFQSIRFLRKDTLYSFGGTGFWQANSILTFFNQQKGEWEALSHPENEPSGFKNQISGYFDFYDKVFVLELPKLYSKDEGYKPYYWSYDLKTKSWDKLGLLNEELFNSQQEIFIAGKLCFFKHFTKSLWADPLSNKLFYYKGNKSSFFTDPILIFTKGNWIFTYYKKTGGNNQFGLDSISTKELISNSSLLGPLYQKEFVDSSIWYTLISLVITIVLTIIFLKYFNFNKSSPKLNLNSQLSLLLNLTEISTLELNKILECENKPSETQRQIRARFISQINNEFFVRYKIENAITRCQSKIDKRFVVYQLSDDAKNLIKKNHNR